MNVCMHTCMYVCIGCHEWMPFNVENLTEQVGHTDMCVCMHECVCMYVCMNRYVCMYVHTDMCVCLWKGSWLTMHAYTHIYIYMYVYMYIYIYIYMHTDNHQRCGERNIFGQNCDSRYIHTYRQSPKMW